MCWRQGTCMHIFGSILYGNVSLNFLHRYRLMQNEIKFLFVCPVQMQVTAMKLSSTKFQALTFSFKLRNNIIPPLCFLLVIFCVCFLFSSACSGTGAECWWEENLTHFQEIIYSDSFSCCKLFLFSQVVDWSRCSHKYWVSAKQKCLKKEKEYLRARNVLMLSPCEWIPGMA